MSPNPQRVKRYWDLFLASGGRYGVDPVLLAAICDRLSSCGHSLRPDGTTDKGCLGVMGLDPQQHPDLAAVRLKDGSPAWSDPAWNIDKGAELLAALIAMFNGEVDAGVAAYSASPRQVRAALDTLEKEALEAITQPADEKAKLVAISSILPEDRLHALDSVTDERDFVDDVFTRVAQFKAEAVKNPPPVHPPKGTT